MDGDALKDRIAKGMGVAARKVGTPFTVYRPQGTCNPLVERNRIIRLCASFQPASRSLSRGEALPVWQGTFDSAYTQAGDYLVGATATYFICSQAVGIPLLCAFTNRVVSLFRPSLAPQGGYSGAFASGGSCILEQWPASVVESSGSSAEPRAQTTAYASWTVLLPTLAAPPRAADIMTDNSGSSYVVGAAEPGALGWRLSVKQTAA